MRLLYELDRHSDNSNPALDYCCATATATADRDADHIVAGAAVGEAGLLERVARRHQRSRELAAVHLRYKPSLSL